MSSTIKSLTLLAVVLVAVSQTSAQELLWDGTGSPETVGYVAGTNSTTTFEFDTPSPGFMTQGLNTSGWDSFTASGIFTLSRAEGWSLAVGIDVAQTSQGTWGAYTSIGDDVGGMYLFMYPDSFGGLSGGSPQSSVDVGSGYHTYLINMPAGGTDVEIFVDGSPSAAATYLTDGATTPPVDTVSFGDGATNAGAAAAVWDFVNLGPAGGIPEPSSLTLLVIGLLGLTGYRRRNR